MELAESEIHLIGPLGEVSLAPLTSSSGGAVLVASLRGSFVPGRYTVQWRTVSDDGHPAQGAYSFVIAPGAQGLAPAPAVPIGPTAPEFVAAAAARAASLGLVASALLVVALVARPWAQSAAVHGAADALDLGRVGTMLAHTL